MHQLITLDIVIFLEKFGVSSEELEQEFPKARRALFLYEIEDINNDNESENMENNNEVF